MAKRVCAHPGRWAPGGILPVCRKCPLLGMQARWEYALSLPEACTEPIPVYREPEPERPAEQTRPLPVVRDPFVITHPQIRPEPEVKAKPRKGKHKTISPQVWFWVISILIAVLLYQLPFIGHP